MKIKSVCVYSGSSPGVDPAYAEAAERFGTLLAEAGIRLVYGGGSVGLMGAMARAVLANGGEVLGIIPGFLRDREVALNDISEMVVTDDMHSRKRRMFDMSDAFVAFPGGIGTLEETVEMMTWVQLGQHRKPVVLANLKDFWAPLVALLGHMKAAGFLHSGVNGTALYQSVDNVDDVLPMLHRIADETPNQPDEIAGDTAFL